MHSSARQPSQGLFSILENMSDAFVAVDLQWHLVYVNGRAERITHQAKTELLGKPIWEAFPETIGSIFYQHYHRSAAHGLKLRFEIFCTAIDAWLEVRSAPSEFGLAFYFADITEQRRSAEKLRNLNDRLLAKHAYLESIFQHIPGGVAICEAPGGRMLYGNERIQEIFGRPGGNPDTVGVNARWGGFHPDGRQYDVNEWPLTRTITAGEVVSGEEIHAKHADGTKIVLLVSSFPIRDKQGRIMAGIVIDQDISDRYRNASALKAMAASETEARKIAESANIAKDQFIAALSHELRTPLTPVLLALCALEGNANLSDDMHHDLVMMRRNVELEMRLIDDLLDVTRIVSGKLHLDIQPTNVNVLLRNVLSIVLDAGDAKGQKIKLQLDAQNDLVNGDGARLQQVFWNVLKNAIKFGLDKSEIVVRSFNPSPGAILIQITNVGEGIAPDALTTIFGAFEQANANIARQFGGLGLGLAISRAILDLHGGAISATSGGKGEGACFTIQLKTDHLKEKLISRIAKDAPAQGLAAKKVRLLVVEDNDDTRRLLCRLLTHEGYDVAQASTVAAALTYAAANVIDVLLSDIGLPDGTGLDLMRQFKQLQSTPGIAISGYGLDTDIQASHDAGFFKHLTKPTNPAALFQAIRDARAA